MKIQFKQGNILQETKGIIAHCVNCVGVMGAGLAYQIAIKYPIVKQKYLEQHKRGWLLGNIQLVEVNKDLIIANLAGQYNIGTKERQLSYQALEICLDKLFKEALLKSQQNIEFNNIFLPRLGCGLAGADWKAVEIIINRAFDKYNEFLYLTIYQ